MRRTTSILVLLFIALPTLTACRPDACHDARPIIEKVEEALDDDRFDAARSGLARLEEMLVAEGGWLGGFGEFSGSLKETIDAQEKLGELPEDDRWKIRRKLEPLAEGWQREARAFRTRCSQTYLL